MLPGPQEWAPLGGDHARCILAGACQLRLLASCTGVQWEATTLTPIVQLGCTVSFPTGQLFKSESEIPGPRRELFPTLSWVSLELVG